MDKWLTTFNFSAFFCCNFSEYAKIVVILRVAFVELIGIVVLVPHSKAMKFKGGYVYETLPKNNRRILVVGITA